MYKKWLYLLNIFVLLGSPFLWAQAPVIDVRNQASLQRGAKLYMNYCSGCHSLKYLRYNQMAEGLGLISFDGHVDEGLLKDNLIFTQASINDPIRVALPPEDALQWFGVVPPDLSLIAREKGADWLYTYLKSFYNDKSRPFGTNNLLKPGVAMPNVLEPFIGEMALEQNSKGCSKALSLVKEGELPQAQINSFLQDLVTFLVYVGEPIQRIRYRIGLIVIAFLSVFLLVAIGLKKVYWRKIP
ncbi:cytochrome c1 [Legionella drancourtii]|uniref:Ubiquinol cytochrome C oxidoreductase cytochrome C1 subunit n=1 Tax=Legionella drancourtii LLAP12 TaxID=658187 RepID=G9ESF5_9GAMM|nr:cytochrome c1 [Legionella drancourtii]EHL29936.1 ubiquinol cytochrome C oxidoreductase cytochrome C1 subunit [Legionella drancourtii LLAP12]